MRKGKKTSSSLEPPEGSQAFQHLNISPVSGLEDNKSVLFQATMFVAICYHSNRKLIHLLFLFPYQGILHYTLLSDLLHPPQGVMERSLK